MRWMLLFDVMEDSKKPSKGSKFKSEVKSDDRDVLLKLGPLSYKEPGKRQRVVLGTIVIGLNILLVIAVIVYFSSPAFQDFVFNVGRN